MKTRADTIDTSEDAAIDARIMAELIDQARKDGAIVTGGSLCLVGLTSRLTRFLINGYVITMRARLARLADPYPAGSEMGNALDALAIMHMRAMDAKPQVAKAAVANA